MPKILYKFPSRERPHKVIKALENIITLSKHQDYCILLTLDIDDISTNNRQFNNKLKEFGNKVMPVYGFSKNKVNAINRDIWMVNDFDILCLHSDDMVFIKDGFDLDILEAFDNYNGLVHFPDQVAKENLITYSMMSREYYDIYSYIYNPEFMSVYCDNYQQDVAKKLKMYKFVNKEILRHEHFCWGYGEKDSLLTKTENPENYNVDNITYQRLLKEYPFV